MNHHNEKEGNGYWAVVEILNKWSRSLVEKGIFEQRLERCEPFTGFLLIFPDQNENFMKQEVSLSVRVAVRGAY